jgi:hypothetical protein
MESIAMMEWTLDLFLLRLNRAEMPLMFNLSLNPDSQQRAAASQHMLRAG